MLMVWYIGIYSLYGIITEVIEIIERVSLIIDIVLSSFFTSPQNITFRQNDHNNLSRRGVKTYIQRGIIGFLIDLVTKSG